jgi:hypothetical protein
VPDVVSAMRASVAFLFALVALPAVAQLPVADLRASHTVLTEVPTLRLADWPPLAPGHPQVVKLRIENLGPADAPDVRGRGATFNLLTPALVAIDVPPQCGITLTTGSGYLFDWPIGLLRVGEARECEIVLSATGAGPVRPPPNAPAELVFGPTSNAVRPPLNLPSFAVTERKFSIAPAVAVLADYSVRIEPSPVRVDPGTSREVSIFITNRGPQSVPIAQWPFYGWLERYNAFGPPPIPPDPFVVSSIGDPNCMLQQIGPIISPASFVELTAVFQQSILPGETRECRVRVEARPNASGERSLRFTQRIFYDGVVDPNLADNVATLRMIFSDPPAQPVPVNGKVMLAALALLLAMVAFARLARAHD